MAKATMTIRQTINYRSGVQAYFAANQVLFNRVASFYFDVIARSQTSQTKKPSPHWKNSLTRQRLILIQSCLFPRLGRTFQRCLGVLPSMRLSVLLVRSPLTWHVGRSTKRKQRLRAKSAMSVHPFRHALGTNLLPSMLACRRNVPTPPFASRSGAECHLNPHLTSSFIDYL